MKIIHIFWSPNLKGIDNDGQFHLWIESSTKNKSKNAHPFQLSSRALSSFCALMKWPDPLQTLSVQFPSDEEEVLLSPIIANLNNRDDREYHQHTKIMLNTLKITNPFLFFKDINYQQFSFDEDTILGDDAKFWIKIMRSIGNAIKKDDLIPAIVALKEKTKITYQNKWEILSADFDKQIKKWAHVMPFSSCLGDFSFYDQQSALQHASDVLVNQLIYDTSFSARSLKAVEGSIIDACLPEYGKENKVLNQALINNWAQWRNQLQHEQFGADFNLCFRFVEAQDSNSNDWGIILQLQSKKDLSFFINLNEYWQQKKMHSDLYQRYFGDGIERQLFLQLAYACRIYPQLESVFNSNELKTHLPMNEKQALSFLREDAWQLKSLGYRIIIPSWWTEKTRKKLKIKLGAKIPSNQSKNPIDYIGRNGLIHFDYQLSMGNQHIDESEWKQLMQAKSELVFFRGEWVEINKEEIEKIQTLVIQANQTKNTGTIQELLKLAADAENYITEYDDPIASILQNLTHQDKIELIPSPKNLNATLRPYQLRGMSWLSYLETLGMNPCLADDMGLGKTIQIIALLLSKPKKKAALLIAPTSVLGNWYKELEKFAPSIKALIHHGQTRSKLDTFLNSVEQHDIVITSYGLLRKDKTLFDKIEWSRLIIDEAQNIKNPNAAQTKAIFSLQSENRIALSGTPIENRLMDLWSIFHFLNPALLNNKASFRKEFELPVQRENNEQKKNTLKNLVTPFILRRLKTDKNIIPDLPEKMEQKVYCELTVEQASLYQLIVDDIKKQMDDDIETKGKKMIMLSALLRLKQCCNHPAQYLQDGSDFSPERSIKLQRLIETTKEAIQNNESILIFSQFTEVCSKLQHIIKNQLGFTTHYLHGGTSRTQREKMIEHFQLPESPASVFILSLKAGGVGITLTKANHVIHFDRWWNPAVENQATDRAYRIGQQKTVFAHKFITLGTVEEKIDAMLEEKQALADGIISTDESWLTELSTDKFMQMIQLNTQEGAS